MPISFEGMLRSGVAWMPNGAVPQRWSAGDYINARPPWLALLEEFGTRFDTIRQVVLDLPRTVDRFEDLERTHLVLFTLDELATQLDEIGVAIRDWPGREADGGRSADSLEEYVVAWAEGLRAVVTEDNGIDDMLDIAAEESDLFEVAVGDTTHDEVIRMFEEANPYLEHLTGFHMDLDGRRPDDDALVNMSELALDRALSGTTAPGPAITFEPARDQRMEELAEGLEALYVTYANPVAAEIYRVDRYGSEQVLAAWMHGAALVWEVRERFNAGVESSRRAGRYGDMHALLQSGDVFPQALADDPLTLGVARESPLHAVRQATHSIGLRALTEFARYIPDASDANVAAEFESAAERVNAMLEQLLEGARDQVANVLLLQPRLIDHLARRSGMPVPREPRLYGDRTEIDDIHAQMAPLLATAVIDDLRVNRTASLFATTPLGWLEARRSGKLRDPLMTQHLEELPVAALPNLEDEINRWNADEEEAVRRVDQSLSMRQVGGLPLVGGRLVTSLSGVAERAVTRMRAIGRSSTEVTPAIPMPAPDIRRQAHLNLASRAVARELSDRIAGELGREGEVLEPPPIRVVENSTRRLLVRSVTERDGRRVILVQKGYADECLADPDRLPALEGGLSAGITRAWQPPDPHVLYAAAGGVVTAVGAFAPAGAPLRLAAAVTSSGAAAVGAQHAIAESVRTADATAARARVGDVRAHLAAERRHHEPPQTRRGPLAVVDKARGWLDRRRPTNPGLRAQALNPARDQREGPDDHGTATRPSGPLPRSGPPTRGALEIPGGESPTRDVRQRRDEPDTDRPQRDDRPDGPPTSDEPASRTETKRTEPPVLEPPSTPGRGIRRRATEPPDSPFDATGDHVRDAEAPGEATERIEPRISDEVARDREIGRPDDAGRRDGDRQDGDRLNGSGSGSTPAHPLIFGPDGSRIDPGVPHQRKGRDGRDEPPARDNGSPDR